MGALKGHPSWHASYYRPVPTSWHEQGACASEDVDQELFFHPHGERDGTRRRRAEAAKAVCRGCPVMAECRSDARGRGEQYGTWGGESEDERTDWLVWRRREERRQAG